MAGVSLDSISSADRNVRFGAGEPCLRRALYTTVVNIALDITRHREHADSHSHIERIGASKSHVRWPIVLAMETIEMAMEAYQ